MSLNEFKSFVQARPTLAKFVNNKEMSWQQFYDMYELYGPNNSIWNKYLGITTNSPVSFKDFFSTFKNMDMTEVQNGITSLQKAVGYIQNIVTEKKDIPIRQSSYEPRPVYKHFDD